jgi:hypothetical protein
MKRLGRGFRRDEGSATVEFVLVFPWVMLFLLSGSETGLLMIRSVMLERAVDMSMRELRMGNIDNPDSAKLKADICDRTVIIPSCAESIRIELNPIDTTAFTLPAVPTQCLDRDNPLNPETTPNFGRPSDIMLVRVCILAKAIFPYSEWGAGLGTEPGGEYQLVASSAFVNEPS